jgi:hypothetical protein
VNGTYNTGALNLLQLPLTRYSAYGEAQYEINSHAEAYGSFNFTHYDSRTVLAAAPAASTTGFTVPVTNPFIPDDLATLLASRADPTADFLLRKRFTDVGPRVSETTFNVFQWPPACAARPASRTGPTTSTVRSAAPSRTRSSRATSATRRSRPCSTRRRRRQHLQRRL